MRDPYRYFRVEAREIVDELARGILALEHEGEDRAETEKRLLRLTHTLKGAARVVEQPLIADLAHDLEDALVTRGAEGIEGLLARVDQIAASVAALEAPPPTEAASSAEGSQTAAPPPERPPPAPLAPLAGTLQSGFDYDALERLLEALQDTRGRLGTLWRSAARFDAIRRRAEDAGLGAIAAQIVGATRELVGATSSFQGDLQALGAHAHDLRLVPATTMFASMERAVHDAARAAGKRVAFEARGGENHLDGRVLGPLFTALLHLVQNAVAHGVEGPEEREALGKSPTGRVALDVVRRGHRITFTCRDDGRGVDEAAVRAAATRRHLSPEGDVKALIFSPGMSTQAEVTPLAGRGVGLDVVAEVAERLGGEVSVASEPGRGAAFSITVPVSLSSMPVLSFEAGDLCAAVPLDAVRTSLRLGASSVARLGDREAIVLGASSLPLLRLDRWADAGPARSGAGGLSAIVLSTEEGAAAVAVCRLRGVEHRILQAVAPIAGPLPVLGASLDLDGVPEPVLDPRALVVAARAARTPPSAPAPPRRRVLAVDDSLTTRMLEQSILASAGYEVDVAASGEEGLEKARARPYDLFIVDVEMPGMNGFEFIARARQDPALSGVPSIIVSSRAAAEDRRRGAEAGARAYVTKGEFAQEQFLELVRGLAS